MRLLWSAAGEGGGSYRVMIIQRVGDFSNCLYCTYLKLNLFS